MSGLLADGGTEERPNAEVQGELQKLTGEVGGGGGGVQDLSELAVAAVGLDVGQGAACMSQNVFVITGLQTAILLLTQKPLQQEGERVCHLVLCLSALCFSHKLHDSRCIEEYRMDGGYL